MNIKIPRKIKWIIYPNIFIFFFIVGFYFLFPSSMLKEALETAITNNLYSVIYKERGTPNVQIKTASLWRLSGVKAKGLSIAWPMWNDKPEISLNVDILRVRAGIFALLKKNKNIIADIDAYGGNIYANFYINNSKQLDNFTAHIKKLNPEKLPVFFGTPITGIVDITASAVGNGDMRKDGSGKLSMTGTNLEIKAGNLAIPGMGFMGNLAVPNIALGNLSGEFTIEKGEIMTKSIALREGDFEGEVGLNITLGPSLNTSKINGQGWFRLKPDFVKANNSIKIIVDIIPELKSAQENDKKVEFAIKGTMGNPRFSLTSK